MKQNNEYNKNTHQVPVNKLVWIWVLEDTMVYRVTLWSWSAMPKSHILLTKAKEVLWQFNNVRSSVKNSFYKCNQNKFHSQTKSSPKFSRLKCFAADVTFTWIKLAIFQVWKTVLKIWNVSKMHQNNTNNSDVRPLLVVSISASVCLLTWNWISHHRQLARLAMIPVWVTGCWQSTMTNGSCCFRVGALWCHLSISVDSPVIQRGNTDIWIHFS